jgi:anti-sigma factor ChrR (cupin superfamily)
MKAAEEHAPWEEEGHALWEELAALEAVGLLEREQAAALAGHLATCDACRTEALAFAEVAGELAWSAPAVAPPEWLRQRVMAGLTPHNATQRKVVRGADDIWQPTGFPGVDIKHLSKDPATGDLTSLVRMAAGALYAPHRHATTEHCYVVEGDLIFADHTLFAGDYSVCPPDSEHTQATSTNGCLLLIVHNMNDQLLVAAR